MSETIVLDRLRPPENESPAGMRRGFRCCNAMRLLGRFVLVLRSIGACLVFRLVICRLIGLCLFLRCLSIRGLLGFLVLGLFLRSLGFVGLAHFGLGIVLGSGA